MKKNIIIPFVLFTVCLSFMNFTNTPSDETLVKELNANGLKIIFKPSTKDIISARLFIRGGTANYSKEQEGVENLALSMIAEGGTKTLDMAAFGQALDNIGANIGASSDYDFSEISLSCIKTYWNESWDLFADAITNPRFDEKAFEVIKGKLVSGAKEQESDPDAYLKNKSLEIAFAGKNYSKIPFGTLKTIEALSLADVQSHYQNVVNKNNVFLVVAGNISEADLIEKVSATVAKLNAGKTATAEDRPVIQAGANIENRDIATNYIKGSMSVPSIKDKDAVAMRLAMSMMGDHFFVELRTKRSLTYAPAAYYTGTMVNSPQAVFYASSTDPKQALQVMINEINTIKNQGFTEKELKDKKEKFLTGHYSNLETNGAQTYTLGVAEIAGSWRINESFMTDVEKTTIKDVNAAFKKYSNSINWMYLGKESAVSMEDFKQPQILPSESKISTKQ
ncbi:MAG TPA: pitrilysin family protein [Chryseosolibacter sp.]|nr:pitrilysin family protein [Chryseosolibacter sp.]